MTHATNLPPGRACQTDPPGDRSGAALPNLAKVLHVVQILLAYGRHLADTFDRRAAAPGFHLIARPFGTSNAAVILAHIRRGILRAAALHEMLLARAARGRDLVVPPLRVRLKSGDTPAAAQAALSAEPPTAQQQPSAPKRAPRPSWHDDWLDGVADPLDPCHQPSYAALQAEVRRRPIGRTLGAIYADLGIAPRLCLAPFWNELFFAILHYDGSPALYDIARWRREQRFDDEQDMKPTLDLLWPPLDVSGNRGDIVQVLGFFLGEEPAAPAIIGPQQGTPPAQALAPRSSSVTPPGRDARTAPPGTGAIPAKAPAATGPP